jgi:hypothetical protein
MLGNSLKPVSNPVDEEHHLLNIFSLRFSQFETRLKVFDFKSCAVRRQARAFLAGLVVLLPPCVQFAAPDEEVAFALQPELQGSVSTRVTPERYSRCRSIRVTAC